MTDAIVPSSGRPPMSSRIGKVPVAEHLSARNENPEQLSARNSVRDSARNSARDSARGSARNSARNSARDSARDSARGSARDSAREGDSMDTFRSTMSTSRVHTALAALTAEKNALEARLSKIDSTLEAEKRKNVSKSRTSLTKK